MGADDDLESWLSSQPLGAPVEMAGESVYLHVRRQGAELGAHLLRRPDQTQIDEALRLGFLGALKFDAGMAMSADDEYLILNRWLPGVSGWSGARHALEDMLNQLMQWRAMLARPSATHAAGSGMRDERQVRDALLRAKGWR
ncbi:MAG TPA: hypothetical protein VIF60_08640 [Burkholderiaceae bacterium]|jgi:hypothetical protein